MKTKCAFFSLFLATQLFAGLGDINDDGNINLDDCKLLASAVAAGSSLDLSLADVDGDGSVTIVDAMRLHQSIGGLWIEPTGAIQPVPELSQEERTYLAQYEELSDRFEAMSPQTFLAGFPSAPQYTSTLDPQQCTYFTEIDSAFSLTDEQKQILKNEGMVVLHNTVNGYGFGAHYGKIYSCDLPVFFTSDALLDPLYKLYDDVLAEVETRIIIPTLTSILSKTLTVCESYENNHSGNQAWAQALSDAKAYLLVAEKLLDEDAVTGNNSTVDRFCSLIDTEQLVRSVDFFGELRESIDFSQFKPRGHYECTDIAENANSCILSKYFRSMMWLGRADCAFNIDSLRQLRAFSLIHTLMQQNDVLTELSKINQIISFFVGDVDGFSLEGYSAVQAKSAISIDSILLSDDAARRLQTTIAADGGGNQLILSQAMWKGPNDLRPELPKIAQICGQRFILDSHLLGRTVEWYVKGRNKPLLEEVPFCLGNNAASSVVASDITTYTASVDDYKPYHTRLGASRVLFEKYPYWNRNLYTLWLSALQSLSQPLTVNAPVVMHSRTWQDKQMNTQLASWAQLRHNTLLYAKQSYTGGIICYYPDGYVEPYPEFYRAIGTIIRRLQQFEQTYSAQLSTLITADTWIEVTDNLAAMAERELKGEPLTAEQLVYLNKMLDDNPDHTCGGPPFIGWYPALFKSWDDCNQSRPCIADVHTIPPSEVKPDNMVLHAATGDASIVIIQAATGTSCGTLFAGAVSSFYQHDEAPIKRLTDSEWTNMVQGSDMPDVPAWFGKYVK